MKSLIQIFATRVLLFAPLFFLSLAGCQTTPNADLATAEDNSTPPAVIALREGDLVRVAFPGAKQLDTAQQIRRDGKIVLPTFGEVQAAGLTPAQLEKHIVDKFAAQLVTKEVAVTVDASAYPVFINGAVLRPGKIEPMRPITVLEAIMEAGGFDYARANLKNVRVIRTEDTIVKTYVVDLRGVVSGKYTKPFYVKPSDIIFVPEKFTLF
jgi:polysaccharide export outer membrane protein